MGFSIIYVTYGLRAALLIMRDIRFERAIVSQCEQSVSKSADQDPIMNPYCPPGPSVKAILKLMVK